jgi:hypothetical protein
MAGYGIPYGVIAEMPHMNIPRGIWKHLKAVIFRQLPHGGGLKNTVFFPSLLPFCFQFRKVIFHSYPLSARAYLNITALYMIQILGIINYRIRPNQSRKTKHLIQIRE